MEGQSEERDVYGDNAPFVFNFTNNKHFYSKGQEPLNSQADF